MGLAQCNPGWEGLEDYAAASLAVCVANRAFNLLHEYESAPDASLQNEISLGHTIQTLHAMWVGGAGCREAYYGVCGGSSFSLESMQQEVGGRPKSRHEFGSRMSVLLSNPDYLLEGFAEKKCQVGATPNQTPLMTFATPHHFPVCRNH